MVVEYFSAAHLLTVLALLLLLFGLYFAMRHRSDFARFVTVLVLMGLNIFQHFFKQFLWPTEFGKPFGYINTAYNVCAALILLSPVLFLAGGKSLRAFLACAGAASGFVPIVLPMRFLGETVFQWEFLRSWTCHALLACSSLLPLLWGMVEFDGKDVPKMGLYFLAVLLLVYANDCVFYLLFKEATQETLYDALFAYNPMQIMGPEPSLPALITGLVPPFLLTGAGGHPVPVLWYAHLVYPAVFLIAVCCSLALSFEMRERFFLKRKRKNRAFAAALRLCRDRKRNAEAARLQKLPR